MQRAPAATQPTIDELAVAAEPTRWREAGFDVQGEACEVGSVLLRLKGEAAGRGVIGWSVRGLANGDLDGMPTTGSNAEPRPPAPAHPNGTLAIDHVVAFTPDLDRTIAALRAAGLDYRRLRQGPTPGGSTRQAFFRMAEALLEVIEAPEGSRIRTNPEGPARLWGLAFLVSDLEQPAAVLGDRLSGARPAVQPGRRIASVRSAAGLGAAVAFMTPGPGAA